MKKLFISLAVVAAFTAPANAADLPARTYTKAPGVGVDPIVSWSGFYAGGDIGWADSRQGATVNAFPAPGFGAPAILGAGIAGFGILPTAPDINRNGVIGGLYAGYNWQAGRAVLGIEGDISGLNSKRSDLRSTFDTCCIGPAVSDGAVRLSARNNWLASIRGRVGYAWDKVMFYGTGGVAFTRTEHTLDFLPILSPVGIFLSGTASPSALFSDNKVGYAAGVGAEWMMTNNWIFRLEYLHYGFQGSVGAAPFLSFGGCTAAVNCRFEARTSDLNIDSVRVGMSYKFGGPVVARY